MMLIAIFFSLIVCMIFVLFRRNDNKLKELHYFSLRELQTDFDIHHKQIAFRTFHLNRYRFLEYNLSEALQAQPEINCKLLNM